MLKKILLGMLIVAVLAGGYFGYNYYLKLKAPKTDILTIIPSDALFIAKVDNTKQTWDKLASTNIIWEELKTIPYFEKLHKQNTFLDSIITHNEILAQLFNDNGITASAHIEGKSIKWLYATNIPFGLRNKEIIKSFQKTLGSSDVKQRSFSGTSIYSIGTIHAIIINDVLLFTNSSTLIEQTINQTNLSTSLNPSLKKVHSTLSKNVDINFFVNYDQLNQFLNLAIKENTGQLLNSMHPFASWAELDIIIKPNTVSLNGFTDYTDSSSFICLFNNQLPQKPEIISILPENVSSFMVIGLSNIGDFIYDYRNMVIKEELKDHMTEIESINNKYGVDLEIGFLSWIGKQMAIYSVPSNNATDEYFVGVHINPIENPLPKLEELAQKTTEEGNTLASEMYKGIPMKTLGKIKNYGLLLGNAFDVIKTPHYAVFDNYVIFGNSFKALKNQIDIITDGTTLNKSAEFDTFYTNNFSGNSNILMYCNVSRFADVMINQLAEDYKLSFQDHNELIKKFEAVAWQINKDRNNMYYNNLFIKYNPAHKVESNSFWETNIESNIIGEPMLIHNHRTNTNDVLIQDENFQLYLIDNKGNIKWKKQLDEKIIGGISQIDAFKNNKLQLLLNTSNKIYLIDILGRDVDGFPIKLDHKATNQVIALDYEQTKEYRILIACENGRVYNFDKKGKPIKGWGFQSSNTIQIRPQHFTLANKDYIFLHDREGQIYLLNRKGEIRYEIKNKITHQSNNPVNLVVGSTIENSKVVYSNTNGSIVQLLFNGVSDSTLIGQFSNNHHFVYSNINQDMAKEYIIVDSNKLSVFGLDESLIFEVKLNNMSKNRPKIYKFNNENIQIGFTDEENQKTYLIDKFGNINASFSFSGATPFVVGDINKDGIFELIIGNTDNKIYTYELK